MCAKSERRTVTDKKSGQRSDSSEWFGIVLGEKMNTMDTPEGKVNTFFPEKMLFLRSKLLWESIEKGSEIQVAE